MPIALQPSQSKWFTHDKEARALLLATRKLYVILIDQEFALDSDHNPPVRLCQEKIQRGKFASWISELEGFDYTL